MTAYLIRHVLLVVPFSRHSGFAINSLVSMFHSACSGLLAEDGRISLAYGDGPDVGEDDISLGLNGFPWGAPSAAELQRLRRVIQSAGVDTILGLDIPTVSPVYRTLRAAGVQTIIAYLGAPMGSENRGLKLWLKRAEIALRERGPDHFVFETEAMRRSGVEGRGLPLQRTSVVPLGVDLKKFHPDNNDAGYAYQVFGIPRERHLVFYSGHFEERKGVAVLMRAARLLAEQRPHADVHLLLLGNREQEADRFRAMIAGGAAEQIVTFGGYRNDLPALHRSCALGVIPSTGWDSMTMSSVEMQSSGLPLIVSRLQGLPETIVEGNTGYTFTPGDAADLVWRISELIDDPSRRDLFARNARRRAERFYSRDQQEARLFYLIEQERRRSTRRQLRSPGQPA